MISAVSLPVIRYCNYFGVLFPFQVAVAATTQQIYEQTDDLFPGLGANYGITGVSGGKITPGNHAVE